MHLNEEKGRRVCTPQSGGGGGGSGGSSGGSHNALLGGHPLPLGQQSCSFLNWNALSFCYEDLQSHHLT